MSADKKSCVEALNDLGWGEEAVNKIVSDLYDEPAEAYFIVDGSIIKKMSSISFLGNWDFLKLYVKRNFNLPEPEIS